MTMIRTEYLGNLHCQSTHLDSGATLQTDAPKDNNGLGQNFSPTDLLGAAYSACVLTILGVAGKTHGFDVTGTTVEVEKIMGDKPRRIVEIVAKFHLPSGNFTPKQKKIIELAPKECPVFNSLHPDIKKTVSFFYPEN